jgi:hypothetical protein
LREVRHGAGRSASFAPAPTAKEFATAAAGPYIPGGFLTL